MISLEDIGPDGADELSATARDLFHQIYTFESREVVDDFLEKEQSPASIRKQMSHGIRYAYILEDGARAGYVAYGMDKGWMHLSKLYLFEGFRGRGIGTHIMDMIESQAEMGGASKIFLDVNRDNARAIKLYRRRGFEVMGYTGLRNRRMIMEKVLKG